MFYRSASAALNALTNGKVSIALLLKDSNENGIFCNRCQPMWLTKNQLAKTLVMNMQEVVMLLGENFV